MSSSGVGCVYALIDPRTDEPRYVGATVNPDTRLHGLRSSPPNSRLAEWFDELSSDGVEPELRVLEEANRDELSVVETRTIARLDGANDLLNVQMSASGDHTSPREAAAPAAYTGGEEDGVSETMRCHECDREHTDWCKEGEYAVDDGHHAGIIERWECGHCGAITEGGRR